MTQPTTGEISEVQPGVFFTLLPPCSCRVAPRVLRPEPSSLVWLVRHMPHPVDYFRIGESASRHAVLRQNGWLLTFDLPHGGEYAGVTCPDRGHLKRVLSDDVIAAGLAAGELP
jgi:hypothetical protein